MAQFQLDPGDTTEDRHGDFDPGARLVHLFHDIAKGHERTCIARTTSPSNIVRPDTA